MDKRRLRWCGNAMYASKKVSLLIIYNGAGGGLMICLHVVQPSQVNKFGKDVDKTQLMCTTQTLQLKGDGWDRNWHNHDPIDVKIKIVTLFWCFSFTH